MSQKYRGESAKGEGIATALGLPPRNSSTEGDRDLLDRDYEANAQYTLFSICSIAWLREICSFIRRFRAKRKDLFTLRKAV